MWKLSLAAFVIGCITLQLAGPAVAADFELLKVKSTSYSIPQGAVFVSTTGSDQNAGTITHPLRTVSAAVNAASEGTTIVIRQGTYREALPVLLKRLTLQPFPRETVWLKGSLVAAGWVADGNAWRMGGRVHDFCGDCFHPGNIDPAFPNAGLPDQVFIDAAPLRQVAARSSVTPGTFYVDRRSRRLFIGADPQGRTVEVSAHGAALAIEKGGQGSIVRGLGFAHYSPVAQPGFGGSVKGNAANLTFENNTFAWSAVKGLVIFAPGGTVRGNTFIYNGMMGLGAWKADGLKVTGNRFAFNNQERFVQTGAVSEAAGAKLTSTRDLQVTDNVFAGNLANGLWLDINISNAVIARNLFKANVRHGVFYEISSNGIIASNIAERNGAAGIALANATHMQVYNNTLFGNTFAFLVQADDRVNSDPKQIKLGNSWIAGATYFYNNLISGSGDPSKAFIWARDFSGVLNADQLISASDFNGYHRREASNPRHFVEWWRNSKVKIFRNIIEFQSEANRDVRSFMVDDSAANPFFSTAQSGNFALDPASVARNAGRDLPPDVALAIGVTNRRAPNLGALLLPGGAVVSP